MTIYCQKCGHTFCRFKGGKVDKITLTEPTFERDLDFLDNDRALEYDQKAESDQI